MGQICQRAVKLVWLTRSASADGYDRDTFQVTSSQPKRLPAPDNEHRREGTSGHIGACTELVWCSDKDSLFVVARARRPAGKIRGWMLMGVWLPWSLTGAW